MNSLNLTLATPLTTFNASGLALNQTLIDQQLIEILHSLVWESLNDLDHNWAWLGDFSILLSSILMGFAVISVLRALMGFIHQKIRAEFNFVHGINWLFCVGRWFVGVQLGTALQVGHLESDNQEIHRYDFKFIR